MKSRDEIARRGRRFMSQDTAREVVRVLLKRARDLQRVERVEGAIAVCDLAEEFCLTYRLGEYSEALRVGETLRAKPTT